MQSAFVGNAERDLSSPAKINNTNGCPEVGCVGVDQSHTVHPILWLRKSYDPTAYNTHLLFFVGMKPTKNA